MPKPNTQACKRLKTAIAEESGNIQGMSERFIAESNYYLKQRVKQAIFDPSQGEEPKKVRYSTAPIPDAEYVDMLSNGNEPGTMGGAGCDNKEKSIDTIIDKKGAFGCNLPAQTIYGGYDEFRRVLKGKAWETKPFCVMDLILRKHWREYIDMLRRDLPKRAMEQFCYSLERNVIDFGFYNTSVVNGLTYKRGAFPAPPQGALDIGTLKRIRSIMQVQGWTGPFEVLVSREALDTAIANWKAFRGYEIQTTAIGDDKSGLEGLETLMVEGIKFIITDRPTRGYLERTVDGWRFVPIRPTIARAGTGEGIVPDVNEDYFNCYTYCNGQRRELYEIGYYVHPTAASREAFQMPQMGGKKWSNQLFNFEVSMIDGAYLDCNTDNFKGYFRLRHAYAFESLNPELMGAIIYRVSPDCINIQEPCCDTCPVDDDPVEMNKPDAPCHDECSKSNCEDCPDEECEPIDPLPTQNEPCPEPNEGIVKLAQCGPIYTTTTQGILRLAVERTGGTLGQATVDIDTSDGTAVAGVDYTTLDETITWEDGQGGRRYVEIPILPTGTGDKTFNVTLSNAVGAVLADGTTNGCITLEVIIDNESTCEEPQPDTDNDGIPDTVEYNATQAAAELAAENNIDLALVTGTGAGGKILKSDVEAYIIANP